MPPNLSLKKKVQKVDELPFYTSSGQRLSRPAGARDFEAEPSPLVEAILDYLEAR